MSYKLVIKDAVWQILGRVISALAGFLVIKLMSPLLGPLRYGDYTTILKYFAIWSALADFGLYVIALKKMGALHKNSDISEQDRVAQLKQYYGTFVTSRFMMIIIVYTFALIVAYFIPSYTANPYLIVGLPLGMLFSATFMAAGIIQLPLQVFWQMKQVSIGLILARLVQIGVLLGVVWLRGSSVGQDKQAIPLWFFVIVVGSVLMSSMTQLVYVLKKAQHFLRLKLIVDRQFSRNLLKQHRKYGLAYYLSSFHTLIVLIFLSIFFPTIEGRILTGIWGLALSMIEILLILPSSIGNSLIHSIGGYDLNRIKKSFGNLIQIMIWMGAVFWSGFFLFGSEVVAFIAGSQYLSSVVEDGWGSDRVLVFLGLVLLLSFVKQALNYLFVATEKQNFLLSINLVGVTIGTVVGLLIIPQRGMLGGVITQLLLEILFVGGSIFVAWRQRILPLVSWITILTIVGLVSSVTLVGWFMYSLLMPYGSMIAFWLTLLVYTIMMMVGAYYCVYHLFRGLTQEYTVQ